jgi:hypothetical protein
MNALLPAGCATVDTLTMQVRVRGRRPFVARAGFYLGDAVDLVQGNADLGPIECSYDEHASEVTVPQVRLESDSMHHDGLGRR